MSTDRRQDSTSPLHNAVSVFLAHFHVRRGNELVWFKGEADLKGVEWKVLPSGSHALERDVVYFETTAAPNGNHRVGVAAFRNRRLDEGERNSVAGAEDEDDQRGARMVAVGAVVDCGPTATPWSQLAATLPHLFHLEKLADALSADPTCRDLLEEWLQEHKLGDREFKVDGPRNVNATDTLYAHDPLFQLPAISNALGPLLPSILKRLLLPSFRLLIYVPAGAPTHRAAGIAFALAELAYAACQSQDSGRQCPARDTTAETHGLHIRGLIGLHDIAKLQDEAKRWHSDDQSSVSWLAWTTDKILLDKCQLYDAVLDMSPMASKSGLDSDFLMTPTVLPKLMCTHRSQSSDGKTVAELRKQTWTTREFAVFRGLDEQASMSSIPPRARRRSSMGRRTSQASLGSQAPLSSLSQRQPPTQSSPTKHLSRQRTTSTLFAFLRFWLSNLWILPYQWRINLRNSYGYVPLSIRSDGGVRASIMLLPDDEYEDSEEDSGEEEETTTSSQHLSLPSESPRMKRLSLEAEDEMDMDQENDPILAACGATQASHRLRKSRSQSRTGPKNLADAVSHQLDADGRPKSPISIIKASSTGDLTQDEEVELMNEARESVRLSMSIFEVWSLWVKELVMGVQDLVEERLIKEREDEGEEERRALQPESQAPLVLTAHDLSALSLSVVNPVDVDLILHLSSSVTDRDVRIQRSWLSLAGYLWS